MSCQLTGRQRDPAHAQALAMQIKAGLAERVGEVITCSIGLGPNCFPAKVAPDMEKPDGLITIRLCDLPDILRDLKLRDLPGIGVNMETRLLASRITSVWVIPSLEEQAEFFGSLTEDSRPDRSRRDRLSSVMDQLDQKYGRDTISLGMARKQSKHFYGTKIAFNRIPDEEEFKE